VVYSPAGKGKRYEVATKPMKSLTITIVLLSTCLACAGQATDYRFETVVQGISVPWGMVWLPDGDMLVTDRRGQLYRVHDGQPGEPIAGLPEVRASGQGGLMDIELHPDYKNNGWIYLTYSSKQGEGGGANTALMRARLQANELVDSEVLYKAEPNTRKGQHFGSRIEFDDAGFLYFSIGDRGARTRNPQDVTRDGGKIYRLKDDGSIPSDNPFTLRANARQAIYSYGHRNPQGMAKNPASGQIWVHEHGPRGGDEINVIRKGANYGWPILSYGVNYSGSSFAEGTERAGMQSPAWYWVPSIAPSGMLFVTSDRYPEWQGHILVGSLKFAYVVLCRVDGDKVTSTEILFKGIGRVRNIRQGPDGYVYVATEGSGIKRIRPAAGS